MLKISNLRSKSRVLLCRMLLLVTLGALTPLQVSAQAAEPLRGMYINGFTLFEGHARAEAEFVNFVKDNKFTYVVFYLRPFEIPTYSPKLSELINTLRSQAGVLQVGVTVGSSAQVVVDHNNQYSGKFDVINLENEFWGAQQGTPERVETFTRFTDQLDIMNEVAAGNNLKVEAYIGWPTRDEMAQIVTRLDRLLIHTYVPTPDRTYPTIRTRFEWISELNSDVEVMPIYSLEKTENRAENGPVFMGQWMLDNSPNRANYDFVAGFDLAESIFDADYNAAVAGPTNLDVNMVGHHYFVYGRVANLPPTASINTPALNHIVVEGGGSSPIEFTVNGSDDDIAGLAGVEWYQSDKGHIGSPRFNGETTNTKVISAVPPYSVAAVPFDTGLYGRRGLYAKDVVRWTVLAQNTLPTATPAFPQSLDVYLNPGDTQTFIHNARDVDGNLFATDWYGPDGYLGRSIISGNDAASSRDIQFNEAGTFRVSVDLFDRAVYMPDNEIRQNKIGGSVRWTVHVGTGNQPVETSAPVDMTGRYIMVRKAGTGTLSLAEVQVRDTAPNGSIITSRNIALNKPASQSTTAFGGSASRAVDGRSDGNYNNNSVTHTVVDSSNPWWRVDLGATYDVSRINIFNRTNCCNERLDGAVVYIGDTPSDNPVDYTVVGTLDARTAVQQFTAASSLAATNVVAIGKATAFDELFESSYNVDRDLDGIPAYLDDNDYNDQVGDDNNTVEPYFDPDGDGTLSVTEETLDTDGDSVPDHIEVIDGTDPTDSLSFNDFDADQVPDYIDSDDDNDGIPDFIEGDADLDNDNIPNRFDLDSDGDGVSDAIEGMADVDGNSVPNFVDAATVSALPEIDQDNDRIADDIEGIDDQDLDGTPNFLDTDSDGDLISDRDETNADHDADGIPNFLDTDSDGDSISDLIEGDADTSGNGIPDFLDAASIGSASDTGNETGDETPEGLRVGTNGGGAFGSGKGDLPLLLLSIITCLTLRRKRLPGKTLIS